MSVSNLQSDPVWEFELSSLENLEDDIVMLDEINEGQIIHNLRERYNRDEIYTWVGANKTVLISVNPFQVSDSFHLSVLRIYYCSHSRLKWIV